MLKIKLENKELHVERLTMGFNLLTEERVLIDTKKEKLYKIKDGKIKEFNLCKFCSEIETLKDSDLCLACNEYFYFQQLEEEAYMNEHIEEMAKYFD